MSQDTPPGLTRPVGIDLFAGAGGMSLGFEQAGLDVAAAIEIDPVHCATHEFNFPQTTAICASVVRLDGDEIRHRAALGARDIDVVFGGAPCQGFSMIGKRALDDPRNQLVFHFVRLVRELQPKVCVFENVKGLTLGRHAAFLDELIAALDGVGYTVRLPYQVLNAADFGVPQNRHRLFLIAARRGIALPDYPVGLPTQSPARTTVSQAIDDLPDADSFDLLRVIDEIQVSWPSESRYARLLRGLEGDPSDYGYARSYESDWLTSSLRTEHSEVSRARFASTAHGATEPISRFRKLPPHGLCNTLRAGTDSARGAFTSPRPIHPHLPRVITVREAARLHSYPDWFRFHATKWHGFRQIGNSVPPLLARAVAAQVMHALECTARKPLMTLATGAPELLRMDMGEAAAYFGVPHNTIAQRTRPAKTPDTLEASQDRLFEDEHA